MRALQELRGILRAISQEVEVLPAVGGAVEDLERPDFEEREDQALNEGEKVFETIFERDPSGAPRLYRPTPPLGRAEQHLFRYFLDGSFRSYFLGTALENERESPVHDARKPEDLDTDAEDHAVGALRFFLATRPEPAASSKPKYASKTEELIAQEVARLAVPKGEEVWY